MYSQLLRLKYLYWFLICQSFEGFQYIYLQYPFVYVLNITKSIDFATTFFIIFFEKSV